MNVHVTIAGRQVQVTLRGHDDLEVLARLETLLARYPAPASPQGQPQGEGDTPQCPRMACCARASAGGSARGSWTMARGAKARASNDPRAAACGPPGASAALGQHGKGGRTMAETPRDFPCCGSTGPHVRSLPSRHPAMTDAEWERRMASVEALIRCGACEMQIWEPDTGDGFAEPNLTMIRPGLRDLAHQALAERELTVPDPGRRALSRPPPRGYRAWLRQQELWDAAHLAGLRLRQPG